MKKEKERGKGEEEEEMKEQENVDKKHSSLLGYTVLVGVFFFF